MKSYKKNIVLTLFFTFAVCSSCVSAKDNSLLTPSNINSIDNSKQQVNSNYFNLANIIDNFLNGNNRIEEKSIDKKIKIRKDFIAITSKFNQGNVTVAYNEYEKLIETIDDDNSLLSLAKVLYEIGYFSLANVSIEKIVYKNQYYDIIQDLESTYKTRALLSKEEEIYFAKLYSRIYFDNSAQEVVSELISKKKEIKQEYAKNDYALFILARAFYQQKKYEQAHNFINKAIALNPKNVQYKIFKLDTLIAQEKYSDAQKYISKIEKKYITTNLKEDFNIKKENLLINLSTNEKDRKYHIVKKTYLEGNFEKAKKDSLSILNFDKDNDGLITLYAKSEFALGNIERANTFFINSYKINKNNLDTKIGIGDIRYIHGDYKNSVKIYKQAYKKDKSNYETLIKLAVAQRQYAKNQKELKKLENLIDKMPKNEYLAYYNGAISIAQKNDVLKESFLKKALDFNPMHEDSIGELIQMYLKAHKFEAAKSLIYTTAFTLEKNYYYYYLCGLYNQAIGKRDEAIKSYRTSLDLNPNFEVANVKLLKLIPKEYNEEI